MVEQVKQLLRFGSVGLVATGIHTGIYALLGGIPAVSPMLANLLAFMVAFGFSYIGHFSFTFKAQTQAQGLFSAYGVQLRFLTVALSGLALNSLGVWLVTDYIGAHYLYATLPMLLLVPLLTFLLAKLWAFK